MMLSKDVWKEQTIVKGAGVKEELRYEYGYLDPDTFRWGTFV